MKTAIIVLLLTGLCAAQGCNKEDKAQQHQETVTSPGIEPAIAILPAKKAVEESKAEPTPKPREEVSKVDRILEKLNESAKKIKTYKAEIYHLSRQPLFDSQTLRTGMLYYQRAKGQSLLRVDFNTLKQDDQPQQEYIEKFYFDGLWLTIIDHQLKEVKKYQLVAPEEIKNEKGVDAFDLITEHLPIVGFTGTDKLNEDFGISLSDEKKNDNKNQTWLRLKVRSESRFKDDWEHIDFCIDNKQYLPIKMVTLTTEEEIYEFGFKNSKVNEQITKSVFEAKVPKGFTLAEEKPLNKK